MRVSKLFPVVVATAALMLAGLSSAQRVMTIHSFNGATGTDGYSPYDETLAQGRDGNLYGLTLSGGNYNFGTVFRQRTLGAADSILFNFADSTNGGAPAGGLTLADDGSFYGATQGGGTYGRGVLFKITSTGVFTLLYTFTGQSDGSYPIAAPKQGTDGNFYGTNSISSTPPYSTVYQFTPAGAFSTIYVLDSTTDGYLPTGLLVQGSDGDLYESTSQGGLFGCGSALQLTTTGLRKTFHSFDCNGEGGNSLGGLIQTSDGGFYGTNENYGAHSSGTVYKFYPTIGSVTVIYNFGATSTDGRYPAGGLTQGTDGALYGTTTQGGTAGAGTIFRLTEAGVYRELYSFSPPPRSTVVGAQAPPAQNTNGTFYGVTVQGGAFTNGTVYSLAMGLDPFVTFVRSLGRVGQTAQILGQGFTGTTSVTFNGLAAASFKVVSDTFLTAVVPSGATTGPVVVTTPGGPLTSNKNFTVSH